MPHAPYFHGDEDLFSMNGVLIAHTEPHHNQHGTPMPGVSTVMTLDQRYALGTLIIPHPDQGLDRASAIVWRTSRGDHIAPASLEQLIARCREVFAGNPRYRIGEPCAGLVHAAPCLSSGPASRSTASRSAHRSTSATGRASGTIRSARSVRRIS